jgi:8-oxo-dGTP pyrophosphatase MutT (NUDIX family)
MQFERVDGEAVFSGQLFSVHRERFRYDDGDEAEREIARHPGAVGVVAHDGERVYLVRQPRESVGDPALLEVPAGKLDTDGESPLETAKRELAEEIGKGAREWKLLTRFYSSPGFADEEVHVYLATGLFDESAESKENERIEIVTVALDALDDTIADCRDAKTIVGLLWLRSYEL